ncbi:MAG TPA: cold shock domain-containing protein [Methyloceanibacter sp.]|nr:cold shock domain-containing protein [Methyloceanibacter sp.]
MLKCERSARSVFVHVTALPAGSVLTAGDKVSFEVKDGGLGKKAASVQLAAAERINDRPRC